MEFLKPNLTIFLLRCSLRQTAECPPLRFRFRYTKVEIFSDDVLDHHLTYHHHIWNDLLGEAGRPAPISNPDDRRYWLPQAAEPNGLCFRHGTEEIPNNIRLSPRPTRICQIITLLSGRNC